MKRDRSLLLSLCMLAALAGNVFAGDGQRQFATEAEKGRRIRAILAKFPLKFLPDDSRGSAPFCGAFYQAMKRADKAIAYIEPVVKTDDMDHPGLERYRSCANYPGPGEGVYPGELSVIGDRAFRLYRLDAARKFSNGLEEIIYGEEEFIVYPGERLLASKRGSLARFTGYQQVDFSDCELYQTLGVAPSTWLVHSLKEAFNAIVRYRRRYYVLAAERYGDQDGEATQIFLYAYQPSDKGVAYYPLTCNWTDLTKPNSGDKK